MVFIPKMVLRTHGPSAHPSRGRRWSTTPPSATRGQHGPSPNRSMLGMPPPAPVASHQDALARANTFLADLVLVCIRSRSIASVPALVEPCSPVPDLACPHSTAPRTPSVSCTSPHPPRIFKASQPASLVLLMRLVRPRHHRRRMDFSRWRLRRRGGGWCGVWVGSGVLWFLRAHVWSDTGDV